MHEFFTELSLSLSLSLCVVTAIFQVHEPWLAGVYWSKGWWRWWRQLDYWSYKSYKAPVKSSPPTNQHPVFLQVGRPSCRPTNSVKALNGKIAHYGLAYPEAHLGVFQLCLWPLIAMLTLGRVAMHPISLLMPVSPEADILVAHKNVPCDSLVSLVNMPSVASHTRPHLIATQSCRVWRSTSAVTLILPYFWP